MKIERFKDVWDALEDDPVERERLKMRSRLMSALQARIKVWNVTQSEAAKRVRLFLDVVSAVSEPAHASYR